MKRHTDFVTVEWLGGPKDGETVEVDRSFVDRGYMVFVAIGTAHQTLNPGTMEESKRVEYEGYRVPIATKNAKLYFLYYEKEGL